MERLPTGRRGQILAFGLLLLVLAVVWAGVAQPLMAWHASRADAIARQHALVQRMAQLAATLPELQRQAATAGAVRAPRVFEGASDAVAAAALQQAVQERAARTGAALSSTEALTAEQAGAYRRISLRVAVNAPWPVLVHLLEQLAAASPQILVDDLQLHASRRLVHEGEAPLDASFVVLGFRAAAS